MSPMMIDSKKLTPTGYDLLLIPPIFWYRLETAGPQPSLRRSKEWWTLQDSNL